MTSPKTPAPVPRAVRRNDEEEALVVEWQDGHLERLPFAYLRGACPCAACKGDHRQRDIRTVTPKPGVFLVEHQPQGRYAIRLLWSDAHYTGIYTYDYLRALCPCEICLAEQERASGRVA